MMFFLKLEVKKLFEQNEGCFEYIENEEEDIIEKIYKSVTESIYFNDV